VTAEAQPKPQSDLKVRVISAVFMLAVTAWEVWMGGLAFKLFVMAIALGLIWEWWRLACGIAKSVPVLTALMVAGGIYIGLASYALIMMRERPIDLIAVIACVIATDTGAYFAGRAIGGPKIAPSISPSKTWAGLCGGMLASAIVTAAVYTYAHPHNMMITLVIGFVGAVLAIVAQAGDFLESAMKRKAGVKDSSHLIPGHGGLLDRLDGLLAVAVVMILVINFR
jgi:phosphatidate cytidylyltransferase